MNNLNTGIDVNGSSVSLIVKKSGDAFLTIMGSESGNDYHLIPNRDGWDKAEKIVSAINTWIKNTKQRQK